MGTSPAEDKEDRELGEAPSWCSKYLSDDAVKLKTLTVSLEKFKLGRRLSRPDADENQATLSWEQRKMNTVKQDYEGIRITQKVCIFTDGLLFSLDVGQEV